MGVAAGKHHVADTEVEHVAGVQVGTGAVAERSAVGMAQQYWAHRFERRALAEELLPFWRKQPQRVDLPGTLAWLSAASPQFEFADRTQNAEKSRHWPGGQ
uniref:Uncharacterized protein n=1 Tax=Odontella aurita TaxID=265563 RepID=A0A7S4J579_9STRA